MMAQWFETSPAGMELIKRFEGCEKRLPNGRLTAYKKPGDPWTVGWGQTGAMPDGRPVVEGLTITQQEADEALVWFVKSVSDPLTRKHFNAQSQDEFDALSSWCYNINHSKLERGEYTLPALVNLRARDLDAVIAKWIQYKNPNTIFEQGLYRRRLAELCVFMGLPWHFALSAVLKRQNGVIVDMTDPAYILEMAEAAKPIPQAPDPPKAPKPVIEVKVEPLPEIAPKVDPAKPLKPMEASDTHRGLSKAESGKETAIVGGVLTGLGAMLPNIQAITAYLAQFDGGTILATLSVIGVGVVGVGAWRWWRGRIIAYEGRLRATEAKI
jgi:GH24 family phage-related lysozyme (muramidase)